MMWPILRARWLCWLGPMVIMRLKFPKRATRQKHPQSPSPARRAIARWGSMMYTFARFIISGLLSWGIGETRPTPLQRCSLPRHCDRLPQPWEANSQRQGWTHPAVYTCWRIQPETRHQVHRRWGNTEILLNKLNFVQGVANFTVQITSNVKYLVKLSADGYISSDDELVLDCNQFQCGGKIKHLEISHLFS